MLLFVYILLVLATGISALINGAIYAGIAGIIGPTLCWFAASGLKGSLLVGTSSQKWFGVGAAVLFCAIGVGIVYHSGFWVELFGYSLSGVVWCLVGLAAGWLSTNRQHAEEKANK